MPSKVSEKYVVKSEKPGFEIPDLTIAEFLHEKIVANDPKKIAVIETSNGNQVTYGEFNRKIQEVANGLLQLGVTKEDTIAFYAKNSLEYILVEFAAIYLGVKFCAISPLGGLFEMVQQVENCHCTVLVIGNEKVNLFRSALDNDQFKSQIHRVKILIEIGPEEPSLSHPSAPKVRTVKQVAESGKEKLLNQVPYFPTESSDIFAMIFSSGTTGMPKAIMHSNRSFLATLLLYQSRLMDGITLHWTSLAHMSGVIGFQFYMLNGSTVILHSGIDIDEIMANVAKYRVKSFMFSPNHAQSIAENGYHTKYDLSCLTSLTYGGSKTPEHLVDKIKEIYKIPILERYGGTEFIGSVNSDTKTKRGSVGKVTPNCEMKVIDPNTGDSLPPNLQGELCFRGPTCFVGYFGNEEKTAETIDGEGWFHSGDLGYYDEDGEIFVVDRLKEIFKYHGFAFVPAELEEFLMTLDPVAVTCVVGVKHTTEGLIPRAYVKLAEGKTATEEDILRSVQQSMGNCKWLRGGVRFVDYIPLTTIGKVDRKYFKNLVKDEVINTISEV